MPSSYSSLLRLELMAVGEKTNTWGTITNTNLGTLLEKSIAGAATIDVTSANVTLTSTNGTDDEARCAILLVTGTPGTSRNIVAPSSSKAYFVVNGSNASVVLKGTATSGVTILAGTRVQVIWNGTDFVGVGLVSPAFTGTPTAPTAAVDTNTTQLATTAFVIGQSYLKTATAGSTYAPINSPTFTGTPAAPTAAVDTNTTQLATTAYVVAQGYTKTATLGATYALIASPTFTGVPAAPTAAVDTNTTQLATTAYVIGQGYLKSATAASTYAPIVVAGTVAQNAVDITASRALVAADFGTGVMRINSSGVVAITVPTVATMGLAATSGRLRVMAFECFGSGIPTFAGATSSTSINGTAGTTTVLPLGGAPVRYKFVVLTQLAPGSDAWSLA